MRVKKFRLFGHNITVNYLKLITAPDGTHPYGICYVEKNLIEVATHSPSLKCPLHPDFIKQVFYHELSHMYMAMLSKNDLFSDEIFIDQLGCLMAQFEATRK